MISFTNHFISISQDESEVLPHSTNQLAPEVCSSHSLDNTPEAEEDEDEKGDSKINSEDEVIESADRDNISANRTSEYECTREANIVRNKGLLRELGLEH